MRSGGFLGEKNLGARLVQGFLKERRGDKSTAQKALREGLGENGSTGRRACRRPPAWSSPPLVGEFSEGDAQLLIDGLVSALDMTIAKTPLGSTLIYSFVEPRLVAAGVRDAFRTPRGRRFPRQFAFHEVPFADCVRLPPLLLLEEVMHQGAMPGEISADQEELLWTLSRTCMPRSWRRTASTNRRCFNWALAWKASTNFLGWEGVVPKLPATLRGPLAYVIGHRCRQLKQPDAAARLFQAASAAPPNSPLAKLARAEVERLRAWGRRTSRWMFAGCRRRERRSHQSRQLVLPSSLRK